MFTDTGKRSQFTGKYILQKASVIDRVVKAN